MLDDGFQHLKLARDADIVLVDATDPFGGGMVLPAGRLREPLSALRRADAGGRHAQRGGDRAGGRIDYPPAHRLPDFLRLGATSKACCASRASTWPCRRTIGNARRFLAFCAIGNPRHFLTICGCGDSQIPEQRSFADHHVYTAAEAAQLEQAALACGADALLCTEKDVWNLRNVQFAKLPVYCCRISVDLAGRVFGAR